MVVGASTLITIVTTSIQLYSDYKSDLASIDQSFASIRISHLPSLIQDVWTADDTLIHTQLNGLVTLRDITFIAIEENGKISWMAGKREEGDVVEEHIALIREYQGKDITIGNLIVQADLDAVYQRLLDKLLIVLATNALKTFLISIFILIIFHQLIGKRLMTISQFLKSDHPRSLEVESLVTKVAEPQDKPDEIDKLVGAVLNHRQTIHKAYQEMNAANQKLDQLNAELAEQNSVLSDEIGQHKVTSEALVKAKSAADELSRVKSEFLASMSHELRTPLNAILGYSQMLELNMDKTLSEAQSEYVSHVIEGGYQLLHLVNDILDLAKIEANRVDLDLSDFDPLPLIQRCISQIFPLAEPAGVTIKLETENRTPQLVRSDAARLRQVLTNLLSNAVKYNHAGGSVIVRVNTIHDDYVRVMVIDSGHGIPKQKQSNVFKLFHRAVADAAVATDGMGIGLAVSKMLVERLGGRISFISEEGSGSSFWVDIPLAKNTTVLIWTDDLRVGVDAIDSDHQGIFALINEISRENIRTRELQGIVDRMISYTSYHFRREELIMEVCGYPDLIQHKALHRKLEAYIKGLKSKWEKSNDATILTELRKFLREWWISHILDVDTKIKQHATGKEHEITMALQVLAKN